MHSSDRRNSNAAASPGFVSPEYFRMLHQSLPGSEDPSPPPSPRRRLVQPVTPGRSSPIDTQTAEFLASSPASPPSSQGISSTAFSPNYFKKFFVEEKELGRGGKGVVLLVKHMLDGVSLGQFACKRVPVGDDHEWLEKVLIEVQLLQYLSHQHLVSYRHVWLEDVKLSNFGPSVPCAFILQQYCNAGDLHNYIYRSAKSSTSIQQLKDRIRRRSKNQAQPPLDLHAPRKLQFEEIYSFFRDITSGLNHLHVNGYIHRDLKPSNCLLHDTGKGLRVLVSDFGEVQVENMVRKSTGATGTISYCAPEVLRREKPSGNFGNFTTKSDIFSLGMILYFLCFAQLPYHNADNINEENEDLDQLRAEISAWGGLRDERKMRPDLPEKLYTFLRRLLSLNPTERPSAEDILHGIKTGTGLDEITDTRPSSGKHMYDDLRSSSRISPVDTPSASPMPLSPSRKMSTGFARPGGPGKLRMSSYPTEPRPISPTTEDNSERAMSPGGSLVLRNKFPSPSISNEIPELSAPESSVSALRWDLYSPAARHTLKVSLLILKILSVIVPCAPVASKPAITYSLLGLATLDVWLNSSRASISVVFMLLHVAIVLGSISRGVLCVSPTSVWAGL